MMPYPSYGSAHHTCTNRPKSPLDLETAAAILYGVLRLGWYLEMKTAAVMYGLLSLESKVVP